MSASSSSSSSSSTRDDGGGGGAAEEQAAGDFRGGGGGGGGALDHDADDADDHDEESAEAVSAAAAAAAGDGGAAHASSSSSRKRRRTTACAVGAAADAAAARKGREQPSQQRRRKRRLRALLASSSHQSAQLAPASASASASAPASAPERRRRRRPLLPSGALRHTDVICGRGRYSKHPGNLTFLSLVRSRKAAYRGAADRAEKGRLARQVRDCVQGGLDPPGRFVRVVVGLDDHVEDDVDVDGVDDVDDVDVEEEGTKKTNGPDDVDEEVDRRQRGNDDDADDDEKEKEVWYEIVEDDLVMEKIKQALRQRHKGWTYKDDARAKKKAAARTSTWTAHPQQQQLQLQQLLQLQLQLQQGGMSSVAAAAAAAAAYHCPQHRRQLCVGGMPLLGALVGGMPLSVPAGGLGLDGVRGAAGAAAGASNLLQLLQGTAAAAALPPGLLPQQTAVSAPVPNAHLASTGIACMRMQQPPPQQQQQQGHADLPTIGFVAGAALGAAAAAQQQTQQQTGKESSGRPQPQPQPQQNVMPNEAAQLMIASFLAMQQQQQQQQQQQGLQRQDNIVNQAAFELQQQMGRQMPTGAVEHTANNPNKDEARASSNDQDSVDGIANQEISHPPNPNLDQANSTGGASNAMPLISPNVFPGGGTVPPQPLDLSALGGNIYACLVQQQANIDNNS